ncbi:hypothetical protein MBLNU13_g05724t1 [Cladosporium sp. NU13]
MDKESWTSMITHQGKRKLPDEVEGSHGFENGLATGAPHPNSCGCVGIFCVRWEKKTDENEDEVECNCVPSLDILCILGRSHIIQTDLQRQFLDHFNGICNERDPTGKRKNVHGGCSSYQKDVITKPDLIGYLKYANVYALISHMNLRHSVWRALLDINGKFSND